MRTLLSHVVNRRFSQDSEDVATEALAFIMQKSEAARKGVMRVLHAVNPDLPHLRFRTQQTERGVRPDMSGMAGNRPFAFIENEFWAGLTDSQPCMLFLIIDSTGSCP